MDISDREREILLLVRLGKTNSEISEELGISMNTVKTHLRKIFRKLNARNRVEALNTFFQD